MSKFYTVHTYYKSQDDCRTTYPIQVDILTWDKTLAVCAVESGQLILCDYYSIYKADSIQLVMDMINGRYNGKNTWVERGAL